MSDSKKPPADLAFDAISIGDEFRVERTFLAEDIDRFAALSGDFSPLHVDGNYAETTEFGARVVHGMLLASQFSTLVGMYVPGKPALYLGQDLAFRRPVLVGETVTAAARVTGKNAATQTIMLATEIRNAEGKMVVGGSAKVKVRGESVAKEAASATATAAAGDGKVALITGGSRGIGAAIARELGRRGHRIAVLYRSRADDANKVVGEIEAAGGAAYALGGDVTDRERMTAVIDEVVGRFGSLDVVINGAIGELEERPLAESEWNDFDRHIQSQVQGVLNVCQLAYPHLEKSRGSIVNMLSQVVHGAVPTGMGPYAVAKYALQGLSRALATEWAPRGIRVNTVSPGLVRTELTQHYAERIFKMEASRTPLRRVAESQDVANAVAFLCGEQSSFVTGVDLPIAGGQVVR